MAQISRNVKVYNGQASFTAGIPTVADWNSDFDTIVNGANAHDSAATAIHAVGAGAVVGTTLTQTLTNKTLTAPVLSGTATGTGTLGGSIVVPLARMKVDEQTAETAGVTLPSVVNESTYTTIATLPAINVLIGDRILFHYRGYFTKGATPGRTAFGISGSPSIIDGLAAMPNNNQFYGTTMYQEASGNYYAGISGVLWVIGNGSLTLSVSGNSRGSDVTIGVGAFELNAIVLRGT